jgi:hypothetical protein
VGCSEIAWHFVARATPTERRRSLQVIGQFLPALVAGALVTGALVRLSPDLARLLPGLWALFFRVDLLRETMRAARSAGSLSTTGLQGFCSCGFQARDVWVPWAVGGTFGIGQLFAAGVLYWNLERGTIDDFTQA